MKPTLTRTGFTGAAAVLLSLGLLLAGGGAPAAGQAILDNGTVQLGVNAEGHLNRSGGAPSSGTPSTTDVGLRFIPTNAEAAARGCLCEGWGAADALSGSTGFASVDFDGVVNLFPLAFTATGTGTLPQSTGRSAVSVVYAGDPVAFQVTHDFHPSVSPNLYEVTVTLENVSGGFVQPRYRRELDFDIGSAPLTELVSLEIGDAAYLLAAGDGAATADPLGGALSDLGSCGPPSYMDCGPRDHGAAFDFELPLLGPGESVTFNLYLGAAATERAALTALAAVDAEVFALGEPSGDPLRGTPNTFIVGFSGVGGSPVVPQVWPACTATPVSSTGRVGTTHRVNATVADGQGGTIPGATMTFAVTSGPHAGRSFVSVTDAQGSASWSYLGTVPGLDTIEASGQYVGFYPYYCPAVRRTWVP